MYEKSDEEVFAMTHGRLSGALANARRAQKDARATGEPSPSTEVHQLVEELSNLNAKKEEMGKPTSKG